MNGHSFAYTRLRGQAKCRWCGQRFGSNRCISEGVKAAIAQFAASHGRNWKSALRKLWESGTEDDILRQARNVLSPRALDRIVPAMLKRFETKQ